MQIRVAVALLVAAAASVLVSITLLYPIATRLATPTDWLVVSCDVGQGDAVLARDPDQPEAAVLIDTGDDPEALKRCLADFGVRRISLLVVTHDDQDHAGAIGSVLPRVDTALIAPTVAGAITAQRPVVQALTAHAVPYRIGTEGSRGATGEAGSGGTGVAWLALAPPNGIAPAESNEASLVLMLDIAGHRALMLADTGYVEQRALLGRADALHAEVVKVAHHGSRDQDAALYERIGATWGLVSVGADNRYGHPSKDTLGTLARVGTRAVRTDEHGSIALVQRPDRSLDVWVERGQ